MKKSVTNIKEKIKSAAKLVKVKIIKKSTSKSLKRCLKIEGDPESKGKLEDQIEAEIERYLDKIPGIDWWNTKNKGEPHISKGVYFMKRGANPGYQDITVCFRGLHVAIEVKGFGTYQSDEQIKQQKRIEKAGGIYLIVTSVKELTTKLKPIMERIALMMTMEF